MAFWGNSGKPNKFLCTISLKKSFSESPNTPRWIIQSINFVNIQQNRHYSANEPPKSQVKGKVAIITGGARGIGLNIAERLLKEEAEAVILGDILIQEMENATFALNEKYGEHKALFQPTDVSKTKQMEKLFKCTKDRFGRVDILINNAGILNNQNIEETININIKGLVRGTFLAFQYMTGKGGVIINNAGLEGLQPLYASPVYCGTNHFAIGFTRSLGHEYFYKNTNVKVMAFCPGPTRTEFLKNSSKNGDDPLFPNMGQNLEKFFKQQPIQQAKSVAKGVISMLNDGENGSIWISKACKFYKIKVPGLDKLKPVSIMSKAQSTNKLPCPSGQSDKTGKCAECKSEKTLKVQSKETKTVKSDKTGKCKQCKSDQKVKQTKKSESGAAVNTKSGQKAKSSKSKLEAGKDKGVCKKSDKTGKCARSKSEQNHKSSKDKPKKASKSKSESALSTASGKNVGICPKSDKTGKCTKCKSEQKEKSSTSKTHPTKKSRSESGVKKTSGKDEGICPKSDKTGKCAKCKSGKKEKSTERKSQPSKKSKQETGVKKLAGKDKGINLKSDKTGQSIKLKSSPKEKLSKSKPQPTKKSKSESEVIKTAGKDKNKSKSESRVNKMTGKDKGICPKSDKTGKCAKCKSEPNLHSSKDKPHKTSKNKKGAAPTTSTKKDNIIGLIKTEKFPRPKSEQILQLGKDKPRLIIRSKSVPLITTLTEKDKGAESKQIKINRSEESKSATSKQAIKATVHQIKSKKASKTNENKDIIIKVDKPMERKSAIVKTVINQQPIPFKQDCKTSAQTVKLIESKTPSKTGKNQDKPVKLNKSMEIRLAISKTVKTRQPNPVQQVNKTTEHQIKLNESRDNKNPDVQMGLSQQAENYKQMDNIKSIFKKSASPSPGKQASKILELDEYKKSSETNKSQDMKIDFSQHEANNKQMDHINSVFNKSAGPLQILSSDKKQESQKIVSKSPKKSEAAPPSSPKPKGKNSNEKKCGDGQDKPTQIKEEKVDPCKKKEHWRKKVPCNYFPPPCDKPKPKKKKQEKPVCEDIKPVTRPEKTGLIKKDDPCKKKGPCYSTKKPRHKKQKSKKRDSIKTEKEKESKVKKAESKKPSEKSAGSSSKKRDSIKTKKEEESKVKKAESKKPAEKSAESSSKKTKKEEDSKVKKAESKKPAEKSAGSSSTNQANKPVLKPIRTFLPTADNRPLDCDLPKTTKSKSSEKEDSRTKLKKCGSKKLDSKVQSSSLTKSVSVSEVTSFNKEDTKSEMLTKDLKKSMSIPIKLDSKTYNATKDNKNLVFEEKPIKKEETYDAKSKSIIENLDSMAKPAGKKESIGTNDFKAADSNVKLDLEINSIKEEDSNDIKTCSAAEETEKLIKPIIKASSEMNLPKNVMDTLRATDVDELETFIIVRPSKKIKPGTSKTTVSLFKEDGKKTVWVPEPSDTFVLKITSKSKPIKSSTKMGSDSKNNSNKKMFCSKSEEKKGKSEEKKSKSDEKKGESDEKKGKCDVKKGKCDEKKGESDEKKGKCEEKKGKCDEKKGESDEKKGKCDEKKGKCDEKKGGSDEKKGKSDEKKGKRPTPCNDPNFPKKFACPRVKLCPPKSAADGKKEVLDIYRLKLAKLKDRAKKLGDAAKVEKSNKEEVSTINSKKEECMDGMNCNNSRDEKQG